MPAQQVTVTGADRVVRDLDRMAVRATDPRDAFQEIQGDFQRLEARWFASHGGGRWPAVSPATRRRWPGHGGQPLVRTGRLRASLMGGAGSADRIGQDNVVLGTSVPYARFVTGRRPLLGYTADDVTRWTGMLADHVMGTGA